MVQPPWPGVAQVPPLASLTAGMPAGAAAEPDPWLTAASAAPSRLPEALCCNSDNDAASEFSAVETSANKDNTEESSSVASSRQGYAYPSQLFIRNTFLETAPDRPPSLEGFLQERSVRSAPVSLDNEDDAAALLAAAAAVQHGASPPRASASSPGLGSTQSTPMRPVTVTSGRSSEPVRLPLLPPSPEMECCHSALAGDGRFQNTFLNYAPHSLRQPSFDEYRQDQMIIPNLGHECFDAHIGARLPDLAEISASALAGARIRAELGVDSRLAAALGLNGPPLPPPPPPGPPSGMGHNFGAAAPELHYPPPPTNMADAAVQDRRSTFDDDEEGNVPVLRLADALGYEPRLGSSEYPTSGSAGHHLGVCKPCAFLEKGCTSGVDCKFCHLCPTDEKKRRKKEKLAYRRQMDRFQRSSHVPTNTRAGYGFYD